MMLTLLKDYQGEIEINGQTYNSVNAAIKALNNFNGQLTIILNKEAKSGAMPSQIGLKEENIEHIYKIKVRQYMTKPSTPEFDFHDKWNNGKPMPMRIMVGRKLKETKGMVQMELWGDITEELTTHCMRCGKVLTNPVSKYFGIGPECGNHGYNNPFDSDEELKAAVEDMRKQLNEIKWTGWIIKSAIEEIEKVEV